ncbi:protein of unknown function [Georgfuchsia toluolica]|uniref:Uncharacterized protein n=1 Tax=Georgfuchsia toluolica TaxID=424218 RepID=A0A916J2N4_9PROT|nr:protein of unknown function [Georgfuchsia toluolica]
MNTSAYYSAHLVASEDRDKSHLSQQPEKKEPQAVPIVTITVQFYNPHSHAPQHLERMRTALRTTIVRRFLRYARAAGRTYARTVDVVYLQSSPVKARLARRKIECNAGHPAPCRRAGLFP